MAKITGSDYNRYKGQAVISENNAAKFLRSISKKRAVGECVYAIGFSPPDPAVKPIVDPFDDMACEEIEKKPAQEYFKVDGQTMIANLENKPEIVRDILRKMEEIVVNNNIYSNMEVMKAFNEMYIAIEMVTKSSSKNIDRNAMGKLINAKALADRILY